MAATSTEVTRPADAVLRARAELHAAVTAPADAAPGTFRAVVSAFDTPIEIYDWWTDSVVGYRYMSKGCFAESLAARTRPLPVVLSHAWARPIVGTTVTAEETDEGLEVVGRLYVAQGHATADEVYPGLLDDLYEWSIGFDILDKRTEEVEDEPLKVFYDRVNIFEYGPCLIGANPGTRTIEAHRAPAPPPPAAVPERDHRADTAARAAAWNVLMPRR